MPKPPLSPFLLSAITEPASPETAQGGCGEPVGPLGARATMDLASAELFVVATLRAWVAPRMRPDEQHPDWQALFRLAGVGVPDAVAFDMLMSIIGAQAKRLIDVHCCRCPALGEDELAMLRLIAAFQTSDSLAALDVLQSWLPDEAVGQALIAGRRFALGIGESGLTLPRRGQVVAFPATRALH